MTIQYNSRKSGALLQDGIKRIKQKNNVMAYKK